MKKLLIPTSLFLLFLFTSPSMQAQHPAVKAIPYIESAYNLGKTILEDLGWNWWDKEGILSLTTDRKNGVTVYIDGYKLTDVFPSKHANFKVDEGTYTLTAFDKKKKKKGWKKVIVVKEDEITELTLGKEGWRARRKLLKK